MIKPARGVIWYPVSESLWVAVAPGRSSTEKSLLIQHNEMDLLDRLSNPSGVPEQGLAPGETDTVEKWLTPEFCILEEVEEHKPPDAHVKLAYSIFQEYRSAKELEGRHDLASYHRTEINNPARQFEEVEMTVSHLYREPHPALQEKSYGARFARVLMEDGSVGKGFRILELGCGTGIFGRDFLREVKNAAPGVYKSLSYTFFDISRVLAKSQEEKNKEHVEIVSFQTGDACTHTFPENAYDLIITNEMIADLPVVKLTKKGRPRNGPATDGRDMGKRLGLDFSDAPPQFLLNLGALRLLTAISQTLRPGGKAYIVEYGSPFGYPEARHVTNHIEYSIHFGHMLTAAENLGLEVKLRGLHEFLGFLGDVEVLDDLTHSAVFGHLLPFLGIMGESSRVYTRDMLLKALPEVARKVKNLAFVPLNSLGGITYPNGFYALRLAKMGRGTL